MIHPLGTMRYPSLNQSGGPTNREKDRSYHPYSHAANVAKKTKHVHRSQYPTVKNYLAFNQTKCLNVLFIHNGSF